MRFLLLSFLVAAAASMRHNIMIVEFLGIFKIQPKKACRSSERARVHTNRTNTIGFLRTANTDWLITHCLREPPCVFI